jgi:ribosomal protein S12 methylthiotransferase accessory factor
MHPRGKKTSLRGSYNMFQEEAIHPRKLHIHEDEQQNEKGFNYVPYHDDLELNWIWAYSWKKQKSVLVPEQLVYYRVIAPKEEPVHRFCYETSNGCALGGTIEEAIFYGLLEVVERDAFLVSWYNRLPLKRLNLELVEDRNILLVKDRIESMGYELYVFDMTMGTKIPAIWAMIVNPKEDAPVKCYSAAGAHPNPEKAIFSALVEVITSVPIYEKSMPEHREKAEELYRDGGLVQEMHDHVLLYSLPKSIERFDFLLEKEKTIGVQEAFSSWYQGEPPLDFTEEVTTLMSTILSEAEDIFIIDQTTPELEKVDVKAVKVIVQGMLTMSFGHQYRRINKQRVKKAPVTVGYRGQEIKDQEINMYPHPFP